MTNSRTDASCRSSTRTLRWVFLQSMTAPAYAQVSPGPCDPNCSHGVHLTRNPDGSYSCQEPPGFESCTGTLGSCPGCVRIVSAQEIAPGQTRVCLNCRPIQVVFCFACPDLCIRSEDLQTRTTAWNSAACRQTASRRISTSTSAACAPNESHPTSDASHVSGVRPRSREDRVEAQAEIPGARLVASLTSHSIQSDRRRPPRLRSATLVPKDRSSRLRIRRLDNRRSSRDEWVLLAPHSSVGSTFVQLFAEQAPTRPNWEELRTPFDVMKERASAPVFTA